MASPSSGSAHQEEPGHDGSDSEISSSTSSGSSSSDETKQQKRDILEEDVYDGEPDETMTSLAQKQVS